MKAKTGPLRFAKDDNKKASDGGSVRDSYSAGDDGKGNGNGEATTKAAAKATVKARLTGMTVG